MSLHVCVNTVWPGFAPAPAAAWLEPSRQVDARGEVYAEASITNERNGKQRSIHARWMRECVEAVDSGSSLIQLLAARSSALSIAAQQYAGCAFARGTHMRSDTGQP